VSLYVESSGQGQDVVLLHGWGFNSAVWHKVADELAENSRVTVIDLPGFGRSVDEKTAYEMNTLVDLLIKVIPQNSILLGWSMGGLIAQAIALKYPLYLKKLILLGSNTQFMASESWPNAMKAAVLEGFIEDLVGNFKKTLQVFLMLQAQGGDNARDVIRELKEKLFTFGDPDEDALRGGLLLLKNTSFVAQLENFKLPVYLMYGRLDTMVPLAAAKTMAEKIPQSKLYVFENSAHAPFISHYDEFIKVLKGYILD